MDRAAARRILAKIDLLASGATALDNLVKPLKGTDMYRLRVGDWRVIYREDGTILDILRIAPRGSAY